MKKIVLAMLAMFATAGLTLAAVVTVTMCDDKKITVKEGDKDAVTYDVKDITFMGGKGGKTKLTDDQVSGLLKRLAKSKGKAKLDITVDGKTITAKMVGGGKKKKKDKN